MGFAKAPSGRELPTESGEGERVTMKLTQTQSHAGSFHHFVVPRLASARSRSGSDTTPWCHSLPSRRFATSRREAFGSSNPSTRRKIENGSMEIRKKLGAKKAEKSLEISAFLVFSRSDRNRPKDLAGAEGLEPTTLGFGDQYSTN